MTIVISTAYHQYINSSDWRVKREERLARDGWACARCGKADRLEVHHLSYDRLGDECLDDLLTLCHWCHARDHGRDPDLPPCLPASWFRENFFRGQRMEIWQEILGDACEASAALNRMFQAPGFNLDDPRIELIRVTLADLLSDCAREHDQEPESQEVAA